MADLRSFLETVRRERPREILDVRRRVSPRHETAAILTKLEQRYRSPILCFHDVEGTSLPVVTNVCGSMSRIALALGCPLGALADRYAAGCRDRIPPRVVADGVVQSRVLQGDDVDLGILPPLVYHEHDSPNPYITAAIVLARDPVSGKTNLSFHRLMIAGRNTTGIYMESGHLRAIHRRYEKAGRPTPVAVFLGAHPIWSLGALYSGSPEVEEVDVIGGLQGEPLDVVPCVSAPDLCVPARAEIVLEGEILPGELIEEGPFGEFTGYATGVTRVPALRVRALTSRTEPLFQDVVSGHLEHAFLPMLPLEHRLLEVARGIAPGVRAVKLPAPLTLLVALEKQDDEEPRRLIEALLRADIYTKHVIVVDADVNLGDLGQVMAAVALDVQADRDLVVLADVQGTPLDPSVTSEEGHTAKMGIDATMPKRPGRRITRNSVPAELLESIDLSELLGSSG